MSSRDKYTVELKSSVLDIKQAYLDYPKLKNLLENSSYKSCLLYFIITKKNDNKAVI